jgi:hypothetical protein
MAILKKDLLYEIERAKAKLDASKIPQFTQEVFKNMEQQCIENAALQDSDNKERRTHVLSAFKNAWNFGIQNFQRDWDLLYLTELAGRVEPEMRAPGQTHAELRDQIRQFRGGYVPPTDRARILKHLDRMLDVSQDENFAPIERAIFEYFHLIRIQPFFNGNKRTANIVMNSRLNSEGLLPICIPNKQVPEFESYIMGAIDGFRESGSRGDVRDLLPYMQPDMKQRQFFDFLGRKELCALRGAENQMAGLVTYNIHFSCNCPAVEYALKHDLSRYFTVKNLPHQIKLNTREKVVSVIGEIPIRTLQQIIEKNPGIKRYEITLNGHS